MQFIDSDKLKKHGLEQRSKLFYYNKVFLKKEYEILEQSLSIEDWQSD